MSAHLRLRDIPALPLLFLLHVFFTLSSLFLRTYELLTNPDLDELSDAALAERDAAASNPPRHVGMVILPPKSSRRRRAATGKWSAEERTRVVECVLNLVELALDEEVAEVSVYEASGLLEAVKEDIMAELLYLPPSPPTSEPHASGTSTPTERLHEVNDGSKATGETTNPVTTFTVFASSSYHTDSSTPDSAPRRLIVHLLPPSASEVVATVTTGFVKASIHPDDITPSMLDEGIRAALQFDRDPDLLIVHSLYEPSGWRSWLPRPAPELGGYPFWTLRISEIYHHSPSLPLLSLFKPLLHLARTSTLPFLRKLGRLVPPPPHVRNEMLDLYDGPGRIDREEWAGAMRAWRAVEQRLGR